MAGSTSEVEAILSRLLSEGVVGMHFEGIENTGSSRGHYGNHITHGNTYNINIVLGSRTQHVSEQSAPANNKEPPRTEQNNPGFSRTYVIRPDDILIAMMGVTGAGKSTFVNYLSDYKATVGHGLQSATHSVTIHPTTLPDGRCIYLMDTPGFDDTYVQDFDILKEIAAWLTATYSSGIHLTGIIYLHPISNARMTNVSIKSVRMMQSLCGEKSLRKVLLATTFWDRVEHEEGSAREEELQTRESFWGRMVQRGSQVFRQDNKADSALRMVDYLIKLQDPAVLGIQQEMVDQGLPLSETAAGRILDDDLQLLKRRYRKEIEGLQAELQEALQARDSELQAALQTEIHELQKRQKFNENEMLSLSVRGSELRKNLSDQYYKVTRVNSDGTYDLTGPGPNPEVKKNNREAKLATVSSPSTVNTSAQFAPTTAVEADIQTEPRKNRPSMSKWLGKFKVRRKD